MLEQIIEFITPGPLSERFEFRTRVLTSWISLGLALGLIMSIVALNSNVAAPNGPLVLVLQCTSFFTITYCLSGFMGMGVSKMGGDEAEYFGWYWWLLPILGVLVTGFWLTMLILGFFFSLFGVSSPSPPMNFGRRPTVNERKKKIRKEIQKEQAKDFLDQYEQLLQQSPSIQQPILERILLKLRNAPPGTLLRDILTDEELQEIFMMLIEQYAN